MCICFCLLNCTIALNNLKSCEKHGHNTAYSCAYIMNSNKCVVYRVYGVICFLMDSHVRMPYGEYKLYSLIFLTEDKVYGLIIAF